MLKQKEHDGVGQCMRKIHYQEDLYVDDLGDPDRDVNKPGAS